MKPKNQEKYDKFMNEQFEILEGHFRRIMLRVINKRHELEGEEIKEGKKTWGRTY